MKVLVADPSRFMRNVFGSIFLARNIEVQTVENGCQALIALEREDFDLACVALELGDMHATELLMCARARQRSNVVSFVAITSDREKAHIDAALAAGFSACFHKSNQAAFEAYVDTWTASATRRLNGSVLLVEDNEATARFCREIMQHMGLTVEVKASAEAAVDALRHRSFSVVVTDFVLAGLQTGLDLIHFIRARPGAAGRTPILALSASDNAGQRIEILRAGANDFVHKPVLPEELEVRLRNLITLSDLFASLDAQHQMVKDMAQRDRLTGLYNRHRLEELAPELMAESQRTHKPLSLVLIDLDHFKRINDTFGHAAGDKVLIAVASVLRNGARAEDVAVRYGGEELLLLLPGLDVKQAALGADRMRRHIEGLRPSDIPVTCSMGVAALKPDEDFDTLFRRADAAAYQAKQHGRNQVIAHQ
ncbi:diguanylate cyclase [Niveibacterium sp.]|uniref:GGDEF domain-containing protein n=1 Tax=Niveibacterium sp. TaxID=2017444 RepID=UPI0035B134F5